MDLTKLNAAITESERFLEKAKAAQERAKSELQSNNKIPRTTTEFAACKRASMDLSRALADLRK